MTDALRQAAQAVLDRWDSPQWEWRQHGPTADLMHALRAALAQPPAPTAQPKLPFADVCAMLPADVSWGDPLTPAMAREIAQAAQPVRQPGAEPIGWQYRWTNPGNDPMVHQQDIDWKPVASRAPAQTIEQRIDELRSYKYTDGKPCYEVRAIYTQAAPAQRQPLSDEQIDHLWDTRVGDPTPVKPLTGNDVYNFARAIEAAHGITAAPAAQKGEKL